VPDNNLIALDADGVLVDYHAGYAKAWQRAFGETLTVKDPDGYSVFDRYGIPRLGAEKRTQLRAAMDVQFWSTLPAMNGALEACNMLKDAGFGLVCVSAVKNKYRQAREQNLQDLGFPLEAVYAAPKTGTQTQSPKAAILSDLVPAAFVDDYAPYLVGVPQTIHKALILRAPNGSPNKGKMLDLAQSTHANLLSFANWWLAQI